MLMPVKEYAKIHNINCATLRSQERYGRVPFVRIEGKVYIDSGYEYKPRHKYKGESGYQPTLCRILRGARARCNCPTHRNYNRYGGRGIRVCDEWNNDTAAFVKWAIENGYKEGLTLDRINNDGNYCPENCRWVTISENVLHMWEDRRKRKA